MENSINSEVSNNKKKRLLPFLLILFLNILALTGIGLWAQQKITSLEEDQPISTTEDDNEEEGLFTVNYTSRSSDHEVFAYETFQIKYPPKYFVTSDDMSTPYYSQGGLAEPVFLFTLNEQPLGNNIPENYIFIRSTKGFTEIEDWENIYGSDLNYDVLSEENIETENFSIYKRVISYENGTNNVFQAYIFLPEEVSYFFGTKGKISEEDFDVIVENIKLRAFID